jgi:hypothetical protein
MVAFWTLSMMAALFGTGAAAQMVQIDSTSMTLVEKNCRLPTVDGFEFEMDTFTWTSEDGSRGRRYEWIWKPLRCTETSETPDTRMVRMVRMVPSATGSYGETNEMMGTFLTASH